MTTPSPTPLSEGLVTLSTLSSRFNFLPATAGWPEVERAMDRLRKASVSKRVDPEAEQDARTLSVYAAVLRENLPQLTQILCTGAAIGGMGLPGSPGQRLLRGLEAIVWGRGFSMDSLGVSLRGWAWVLAENPRLSSALSDIDPAWNLEQWAAALAGRIDQIWSDIVPDIELINQAQLTAWEHWRSRLRDFLGGSGPATALSGADLLCHVAGRPPSVAFQPPLGSMSISAWSDLVANAVLPNRDPAYAVPEWVGDMAKTVLGFRPSGSPAGFSILVVRRDHGSQAGAWLPSREVPILALPSAMAAARRKTLADLFSGNQTVVGVELDNEGQLPRGSLPSVLSVIGPTFAFNSVTPSAPGPYSYYPVESVTDLIGAATRALRETRFPKA
jgi:hypothetical protein